MKKHTFQEAMDIFAKMFEGWNMVDSSGVIRPITFVDLDYGLVANKGTRFGIHDISHIEQTKPMNGDEVWAYYDEHRTVFGVKLNYVGVLTNGIHVCETSDGDIRLYKHIKLIAPFKTLTIEDAEKMLNELTKENYKITPKNQAK